ncbi:MAG: NADP-dependent isocitrate dehydrogenase [Alphaproteobacteria bacterium]|nr:NADP-dependent isocitrate dehydrogenase [Alphaproteobacteria bacterium]OJV13609.1 MAG: isocitrate dehydrogenase [Alphaproteobacteria bacterium 33-17]
MAVKITVAHGDGIGPEIMDATLRILKEAKADITIETIEVGEAYYKKGFSSGIPNSAWESIERTKIILKAPITTPQGGGYKSLNVTLRKTLGLYANIRPCIAMVPFVPSNFPKMNLVIVRENEEDLYAGIEYRQTRNMYQTLKLISRTGSEKIVRYAFDYAVKNGRKKVTCFSKDNIMKMTDGIFHKVFDEIAKEYPSIETNHMIIDIGAAKLAAKPEMFDVIVTSNLYGDIVSDIAAEVCGSVGLAGSANIGKEYALFEAIHGSAPDIAGKDIANPSGLLNGAVMMLVHIGQPEVAAKIQNALYKTLEDGIHTADIYNEKTSSKKVGTKEFADEVIKRLGQLPSKLPVANFAKTENQALLEPKLPVDERKQLVGVDVFIDQLTDDADIIASKINNICDGKLRLQMISAKGLSVWPKEKSLFKAMDDHWRLRFVPIGDDKTAKHADICDVLNKLIAENIDFIKTENLYTFDDQIGFSLGQGE